MPHLPEQNYLNPYIGYPIIILLLCVCGWLLLKGSRCSEEKKEPLKGVNFGNSFDKLKRNIIS